MSSIDKKAFGISDSLINAVNEALKGGQVKIDVAEPKGKITGADFKKLRGEDAKPDYIDLDKDGNKKEPMKHAAKQVKEEAVAEGGMPASVIKSKQNRANMTDKQFADSHKNHSDADLRSMAWRHGFGKPGTPGHDHYVNKRNKGLKEDVEQVDEISTKLAVNYAKGALKSMDTAAAKGSAGHDTFMKRSAGQKLALDKTNPEYKRLKAKVGTTDANAKDAAYKKTVGEDVEQVDELSKATLGSYVNKSASSLGKAGYNAGSTDGTAAKLDPHIHTINKRSAGIKRAVGKLAKEDTQIDELSTDTYHSAAQKAAKRAMGDVQGRSGPIFKKYAGMANKFRDKGMSQEKKEKAMKEETDPGFVAEVQRHADVKMVKVRMPDGSIKYKKVRATTDVQHEANDAVSNQIAAKKDAFKTQLQQKIASKQMNVMQAKANKRLSSINASNDKCSCQEGKGKSMTCEMHGDKSKDMKGGNEPITVNPPMREAAELPKKVITKGHEIAKSIIKNRAGVDNPYAVGMAQAKKSAKMKDYRADRDKNKED